MICEARSSCLSPTLEPFILTVDKYLLNTSYT
jgi:hypothetical protein